VIGNLNKIFSRSYKTVFVGALMAGAAVAGGINTQPIVDVCVTVKTAVPVVAFTMLIIGGLIYAAGQIMGAETRARANVWATALVVGAIIGLVIAASAPFVVSTFAKFFSDSTLDPTVAGC
jgi:phosphate/sulfate permease